MSRLKNPTLRNRTEELCEHANNFEETYQIGCELQNIGNITFYNAQQLIKWVEDQQRINEDPDYGIGNWS